MGATQMLINSKWILEIMHINSACNWNVFSNEMKYSYKQQHGELSGV